jgi:hypothetical protein
MMRIPNAPHPHPFSRLREKGVNLELHHASFALDKTH